MATLGTAVTDRHLRMLHRQVDEIVLALDADAAGQQQWRQLARQAALRGKGVEVLEPMAYGGYKDVNEAWMAGALTMGAGPVAIDGPKGPELPADLRDAWDERAAIMECDGRLARSVAKHAAWRCLTDALPQ